MVRSVPLLAAGCLLAVAARAAAQPPPPQFPTNPPAGAPSPTLPAPVWVPGTPQPSPPAPAPPPGINPLPPPPPPLPPPSTIYTDPARPGLPPVPWDASATLQPPGFFAALEIGLLKPDLDYNLSSTVTVNGFTRLVSVPAVDLDWTGVPRIEIGYNFPERAGAIVGSYRAVVSDGTANITDFDPAGDGFVKTRLNANIVDLDYRSDDIALAPYWDLRWRLGARIAAIYADSQATGLVLEQSWSNNFVGAGPHFGVEARRALDIVPGLALFGRLDGAVVIGGVTQSFEEIRTLPNQTRVGGAARFSDSESVPVLNLQAGVTYTPAACPPFFRISAGYEIEQWWGLADARGNSGDLTIQGLFFRGEFRY